jgi:hypothetical protein
MLLHRHLVGCWLWFWNENRFFRFNFQRTAIAWTAGDGPLAKAINGRERRLDTTLIEPGGDLGVSPMLAAQRENDFTMRFQSTARPARGFNFGLWLQIHFLFVFYRPIIPSDVCANFAENLRNAAPGGESL